MAYIKHSPATDQINIEPHTKGLLTQFLSPNSSCPEFNQKLQVMPKARKKVWRDKQVWEPNSEMTQTLQLSYHLN